MTQHEASPNDDSLARLKLSVGASSVRINLKAGDRVIRTDGTGLIVEPADPAGDSMIDCTAFTCPAHGDANRAAFEARDAQADHEELQMHADDDSSDIDAIIAMRKPAGGMRWAIMSNGFDFRPHPSASIFEQAMSAVFPIMVIRELAGLRDQVEQLRGPS